MDAKVANSAKFLDAISALSANFSTTAGGGGRSGDDAGFSKLMDQMQARARQAQDARQAAENNRPRERAAAPKVAGLLSAQAPDRRDDAPPAPERAEAPAAAQPKNDAAPTRQGADRPPAPPAKTSAKASAKDAGHAADAAAKDQAAQDVAENQSAEADATETEAAETAEITEAGAAEANAEQAETVVEGESETADANEAVVAAPVVVVTTEAAPAETGAEIAAAALIAPQTTGESPVDETSVATPEAVAAPTASAPAAPVSSSEEIPVAPTAPTLTDEAAPAVAAAPVAAASGQVAETALETAAAAAPVVDASTLVTDAGESVDVAAMIEQTPTTEEEAAATATMQAADKPAEKTEAKPTVAAPTVAPAPTPVTAATPQVSADDATAPTPAPVEAPVAAAAGDADRMEENAAGKTAAAEGEAKPQAGKKADGEQVKTNPATAPTPAENADPRRGGEQNNERRNGGGENQRLGGGLGLAAINELAPATETAGGPAKFDSFLGMSADGVKQTTAQVGEAGAASGLRATRGGHAHLQQSGATDQVAVQIKKAAKDGIERISMQLRPEELGRVDVRMEIGQDGKVTAQIAVERAQTLELLQKDQKALEKALQEAGFNADSSSLSFSLKEQGGEAWREQAEQNGGGRRRRAGGGQDEEDAAANVVAYTVNVAAGRVDVRV
jgi:flagellar hook-length control protein FliK